MPNSDYTRTRGSFTETARTETTFELRAVPIRVMHYDECGGRGTDLSGEAGRVATAKDIAETLRNDSALRVEVLKLLAGAKKIELTITSSQDPDRIARLAVDQIKATGELGVALVDALREDEPTPERARSDAERRERMARLARVGQGHSYGWAIEQARAGKIAYRQEWVERFAKRLPVLARGDYPMAVNSPPQQVAEGVLLLCHEGNHYTLTDEDRAATDWRGPVQGSPELEQREE